MNKTGICHIFGETQNGLHQVVNNNADALANCINAVDNNAYVLANCKDVIDHNAVVLNEVIKKLDKQKRFNRRLLIFSVMVGLYTMKNKAKINRLERKIDKLEKKGNFENTDMKGE